MTSTAPLWPDSQKSLMADHRWTQAFWSLMRPVVQKGEDEKLSAVLDRIKGGLDAVSNPG